MKNRIILLLTSTLLAATSVGAISNKTSLTSFKCGSLHTDGSITTMEASANIISAKKLALKIYLINDQYTSGVLISSIKFTKSAVKIAVYDNEYTRSSNQIRLEWLIDGNKKAQTLTITPNVHNGDIIRLNSPDYTYVSNSDVIYYDGDSGTSSFKQSLTFYNFQDKYVPEYYHMIDLSNLYIVNSSTFQKELICESASFYITNVNNTFSRFGNVSKVKLPLKLVNEENKTYLAFSQPLYVHPQTLEMSPNKENGFVETKHFYLPRGLKRNEETYECQVRINEIGVDNNDYVVNFRYKSLLNTFGDCRNSEFCIVNR